MESVAVEPEGSRHLLPDAWLLIGRGATPPPQPGLVADARRVAEVVQLREVEAVGPA